MSRSAVTRGFILPPQLMLYGAIAAGVVIATLSAALWFTSSRLDICREQKAAVVAEFNSFKAQVRHVGEAAEAAARKKEAEDKTRKEKADAKVNSDLARLRAANQRLRDDRDSRSSILPPAAAGARDPSRACVDRAEYERAYRALVAGLRAVGDESDETRLNLNNAREWAQGD